MNIYEVIEENRELIMCVPNCRFISVLKRGNDEVIIVNVSRKEDEGEQPRILQEVASKIPRKYRIELHEVKGGL